MNRFRQKLDACGIQLRRGPLQTLQLNLGRKCNQACQHCHVDAAPWRTEMMTEEVARRIGGWIRTYRPTIIDLTGGAPELNPNFRFFVELARELQLKCIDRNNLTILEEPGFEDLPQFMIYRNSWRIIRWKSLHRFRVTLRKT
jgi:MoaA/NifB/PqqE/SkfB family radical SAM enzyme